MVSVGDCAGGTAWHKLCAAGIGSSGPAPARLAALAIRCIIRRFVPCGAYARGLARAVGAAVSGSSGHACFG